MTVTTQDKLGVYNAHQEAEIDGREIDKRALLSCASRMREALDKGAGDMKTYVEAIRHNQKLWTMFQVALCDPENLLPRDLKMTLLSLSRYIDRVSFNAITNFAPQILTSLIDINRTIAAGLAKKAGSPQTQVLPNPDPTVPAGSVMRSA
jgi:flagellar biosynthesis activator protein FlaF